MKRSNKYKCNYCDEYIINCHEGYVCPCCDVLYKEIGIRDKDSDKLYQTIIVEQE